MPFTWSIPKTDYLRPAVSYPIDTKLCSREEDKTNKMLEENYICIKYKHWLAHTFVVQFFVSQSIWFVTWWIFCVFLPKSKQVKKNLVYIGLCSLELFFDNRREKIKNKQFGDKCTYYITIRHSKYGTIFYIFRSRRKHVQEIVNSWVRSSIDFNIMEECYKSIIYNFPASIHCIIMIKIRCPARIVCM